jgi:hypothetical protein
LEVNLPHGDNIATQILACKANLVKHERVPGRIAPEDLLALVDVICVNGYVFPQVRLREDGGAKWY